MSARTAGTARTGLGPGAAAVALVARSELRRRWRTYVVLGVLLGATAGLAIAGFAGARRGVAVIDRYERLVDEWTMAIVPNDPAFTPAHRLAISGIDGVERAEAFSVAFVEVLVDGVVRPALWPGLAPTPEPGLPVDPEGPPLVDGRMWDLGAADEVVVDENARRNYGIEIGERIELRDEAAPDDPMVLTVVGIMHSAEDSPESGAWLPSPGFVGANPDLTHVVNLGLWLEDGAEPALIAATAAEITGFDDLPIIDNRRFVRQLRETTAFEAAAVRLWAAAVALAGLTLVGQAVVRTVAASGAEVAVLAELGLARGWHRLAVAAPAALTATVAAAVAAVTALVASAWFPIGLARGYDLDPGMRLDPAITAAGLAALAVLGAALAAYGGWRGSRRVRVDARRRPGRLAAWALRAPGPVPLRVGLRLAAEPGRGRRALPVRSALIGVAAGVAGVMAAFTFRSGLEELLAHPERAGTSADVTIAPPFGSDLDADTLALVADDDAVDAAVAAVWHRDFEVDGMNISTWTFDPLAGRLEPTVLRGRIPSADDEMALAPESLEQLGVGLGDVVAAGPDRREVRVVGEVLLPEESHQGYLSGGFMTFDGFATTGAEPGGDPSTGAFGGLYVRWAPGEDGQQLSDEIAGQGWDVQPTAVPGAFDRLSRARFLSLGFALVVALLGVATLAHALVLTVRRRRHEIAVLGALGMAGRGLVGVITGQATAIALVAVAIGAPVGILLGRAVWRAVISTYSFLYVAPPAALLAALVVPAALGVANATALAPGWMARRVRIAAELRAE